MHSGRPHYHVKAKWIAFTDYTSGKGEFFELDEKGNLLKKNAGKLEPTRVVQYQINTGAPPPPVALIEEPKKEENCEFTFVPPLSDDFDTFVDSNVALVDEPFYDYVVF